MFRRGKSKAKNPAEEGSSNPQPRKRAAPIRNQPTAEWANRPIDKQTVFDLAFFETDQTTHWAVQQIHLRQLTALCGPFPPAYPRLVRLFYQNLKVTGRYGDSLSSEIDGHEFRVTANEIAHALGCHPNAGGFPQFPATPTVASITNEMCGGRFSKDNYTSTRRSYLPQRLWLIDQVLRANAFPTHHKDERRGDFLEALYAIHSGYAVSLPEMIFQEMCKIHKLFTESKKDPEKKRPLPFPHLLTLLFLHRPDPTDAPLPISSDEESIPCSDMYGEVRWTQSVQSILRNMQHARPAMMPGVFPAPVDAPYAPQAPPVVHPPEGHADPFSMSYAQYEAILQGQQALHSRQVAFETRFEDFATTTTDSLFEMRSLLRSLRGLSPPHDGGGTSHDGDGAAD